MEAQQEINTNSDELEAVLWPYDAVDDANDWVYAVLDGAQSSEVFVSLADSYTRHECLYEGVLHSSLRAVAPFLVRLRRGTPFTQWIIDKLITHNWGILLTSSANFKDLRSHLRRFLRVKKEDGSTMLFRWYDPRVIRFYLPTCTCEELKFTYGPIDTYYAKSEMNGVMLAFSRENDQLVSQEIATNTPKF
jgi:hypothetical protein